MARIEVGLSTKLGLALATVLGSATVIQAFLDGDHSDTTIATLAGLVLAVYKIMDGRYNQATASAANVSPTSTDTDRDDPALVEEDTEEFDVLCDPHDEVRDLHEADQHLQR